MKWTPLESKIIFDETQKYFKESKEIQEKMIAYYRQQSTSVFLHKVDQQFYKKVMRECLKSEKSNNQ